MLRFCVHFIKVVPVSVSANVWIVFGIPHSLISSNRSRLVVPIFCTGFGYSFDSAGGAEVCVLMASFNSCSWVFTAWLLTFTSLSISSISFVDFRDDISSSINLVQIKKKFPEISFPRKKWVLKSLFHICIRTNNLLRNLLEQTRKAIGFQKLFSMLLFLWWATGLYSSESEMISYMAVVIRSVNF